MAEFWFSLQAAPHFQVKRLSLGKRYCSEGHRFFLVGNHTEEDLGSPAAAVLADHVLLLPHASIAFSGTSDLSSYLPLLLGMERFHPYQEGKAISSPWDFPQN